MDKVPAPVIIASRVILRALVAAPFADRQEPLHHFRAGAVTSDLCSLACSTIITVVSRPANGLVILNLFNFEGHDDRSWTKSHQAELERQSGVI